MEAEVDNPEKKWWMSSLPLKILKNCNGIQQICVSIIIHSCKFR